METTVMLRKKLGIFKILAIIIGLSFSLTISELALRTLNIKPERHATPKWMVKENGGYTNTSNMWGDGLIKRPSQFSDQGIIMGEYIPGAEFQVVYSSNPRKYFNTDNGVVFKINSLGMRGPEVNINKSKDVVRIIGIGDSFTFGEGVHEKDTFLRKLEHTLNSNKLNDKAYEVLNAGVQGYNSHDEVIYLEHKWIKLEPDVILIAFYLNDAYADNTFLIRGEGLGVYLAEPYGLAKQCYLLDLIQHEYAARNIRRTMNDYYGQSYFRDSGRYLTSQAAHNMDWQVSRTALQRSAQLAQTRQIPIMLIIFPEFHELDGNYPFTSIHELVKESCESFGMPVLDLLEIYRGHRDRDLWVHPTDHHPNEIAHKMAATAIERFLRKHKILDN